MLLARASPVRTTAPCRVAPVIAHSCTRDPETILLNLHILGGAGPSLALALVLLAVTFLAARHRAGRPSTDLAAIDQRQRSSRDSGLPPSSDPKVSDYRPFTPG